MITNNDYFLLDNKEILTEPTEETIKLANNILDFLKQIRPNLKNENNREIEIRLLRRDRADNFLGTFRISDFNKYTENKLIEFLTYVEDFKYCTYYSVYSFDKNILPIVNAEKKKTPKIAKNNAKDTNILVADFDNISEENFDKYYIEFISLNIEPSITIFSGHGYQCIWKLNKNYDDLMLLKKFTKQLLALGFPVDDKIKDCARLMRVPGTFNCKDLDSIIPTYIYKQTLKENKLKEYSVEDLFTKIKSISYNTEENCCSGNLQEIYPMLNIKQLPLPIQKMLQGFVEGKANNVLMFLTLYFRELGFSKGKIKEIISILAKQGTYPWDEDFVLKEVDRFFYNRQYLAKTVYLSSLKEFGYFDFQLTNNENLKINNYVMLNVKNISSKAFIIYLQMLISVHNGEENSFTLKDISDLVKCSERRLKDKLDELLKIGLLDKKRSYKKDGNSYLYYINGFLRFTEKGFTNFHIASLKLLLKQLEYKEINETQVIICLYLKQRCYNENNMCYLTLETIGNDLGFTKSTISKAFNKIEKAKLITRTKIPVTDFQYRYNYFLNY